MLRTSQSPLRPGRYTFAADMKSRTTPELGARVQEITRTFLADFEQFISLDFPGNDCIETMSLAVVKYWLPPVKWSTSKVNLAVLAAKAYPRLTSQNVVGRRQTRSASKKLGADSSAANALAYIYDPPPELAPSLPLMDQRDYRGIVLSTTDKSLNIRPASYIEVPQEESDIKLENYMPKEGGRVMFVFGKGCFQ